MQTTLLTLSKYLLILFALLFSTVLLAQKQETMNSVSFLEQANAQITDITTAQLQQQIKTHPDTVLIDVRTPQEINLLGAIGIYQNINIPRGWLEDRINNSVTSLDTPIVVYCGLNIRSPLAAKRLMAMGYRNVKNYAEGFFKWQEAKLDVNYSDKAPDSILYSRPEKVIADVYSAIGAPAPGNYQNSGHNNNLSFIIGDDAVLVFNAGGSFLLAQAMHEEIKQITAKPVKYVVLENAQGHAVLGSSYWKTQGASIIGHYHTTEILKAKKEQIKARAKRALKDKFFNTDIVLPDIEFSDKYVIDLKGKQIELYHLGPSHSPDDVQLWMPEEKLLISGDIAFNVRMLPILDHTDVQGWIKTWDKVEALKPELIVPGHGGVTDLATATRFTKDYLVFLRTEILNLLDEGGELGDALNIDQSRFDHFKTYRELHKQNVDRLFRVMEFGD